MIYDIPACNYPTLAEAIEKLNRRAPKLGCQPIELRILREFAVEQTAPNTRTKYMQARCEIEVLGESPRYEGWTLLAAVQMLDNGENLIRAVPGRTVPEAYRTTDTHCDHCHAERRRKEVFILGHDDGRFVQVGRQCIADFLGHVSAENLANRAEWEFAALDACRDASDEDYTGRSGGEWHQDIGIYLATVAICIRRLGWLSRAMIERRADPTPETTTAMLAWQLLVDHKSRYIQELVAERQLYAEDRDTTLANDALAWARERPAQGTSDYEYNLGVACRQVYVTYKTVGIVASAVSAYLRHLERNEELNIRRKQNIQRRHVGEVSKRGDFANLTVKRLRYFDSQFGVKTLVQLEDPNGNVLVWWASKEQSDIEVGDMVDMRATVAKHSDYKGCPQTEVKRATFSKHRPAAEETPAVV